MKWALHLTLNGETMPAGNRDEMIFGVTESVSYLSRFCMLMPGELIATGTQAGMGACRKPELRFPRNGDVTTLSVDGLGSRWQCIQSAN